MLYWTYTIWIAASYGFSVYVGNFSKMIAVYGFVSAIMLLMIWLNIICHVLLLGGVINAALLKYGACADTA